MPIARVRKRESQLKNQTEGFTLAEMAIVLVIFALLIGGMIIPLSTQVEMRDISETNKTLSEIKESLIGYAASHSASENGKPYFPCPDTDNDGKENRLVSGSGCTLAEGGLPWSDLGIGRQDSWGNRFRYRVSPAFSKNDYGFSLGTAGGTLRVCGSSTCTEVIGIALPAIIVSHGRNGAGAFNSAGTTNTAPLGLDEISNQNSDDDFVEHSQSNVSGSEFDDIVTWISPYILFNRMISANRLP